MKTNAKNSFLFHKLHLFYMGSAMSVVSEKWGEKKKGVTCKTLWAVSIMGRKTDRGIGS